MAVKFRNLGITSDAPIEQWGVEGILTAIDRGTSQEWARIARAVQADPYGDVALDLEQAIELAESPGITALMTRVLADARASDKDKLARKIKAGTVRVNAPAGLDLALPFGGYKESGVGRELGREGVEAYTELKSVAIAL